MAAFYIIMRGNPSKLAKVDKVMHSVLTYSVRQMTAYWIASTVAPQSRPTDNHTLIVTYINDGKLKIKIDWCNSKKKQRQN